MVMVYVPGGTFWMGGSENDSEARGTEFPRHRVTLDAFWIDQTEVTNAQYALCVADGACDESPRAGDDKFNGDDYPVVDVLWSEADAYCKWARVHLPTEAQWEYAARGEEGYIYPWGGVFDCRRGNFDDETELTDYVVPGGEGCDGYARTAPVGSFPDGASWCGALDLAGNVWEWTADWYGDYSAEEQTNPTGPAVGDLRVLRGGGWYDTEAAVRAVFRNTGALDLRYYGFGFRCAVGIP
jgi:formylglycine-generating enzyme required for sulfatase activity